LNLRFSDQRAAEGDSDSILSGDLDSTDDADLSLVFWGHRAAMDDSGSIL
jgi:hypothetical protein